MKIYDKNNNLIYEELFQGYWTRYTYIKGITYTVDSDGYWFIYTTELDIGRGKYNLNYPKVSIVL